MPPRGVLLPRENCRYVLYSSSVIVVLSTGVGVHSFTLDPTFGEFIESSSNPIAIPAEPRKIVSVNGGNELAWDKATADFVSWTKRQHEPYSQRYIGSMVSDVHRTILYGGIFMYPADTRNKRGKLRMLYECFPMAFLIEAAGGLATTGRARILELVPSHLHERSPIFLGCKRDIAVLEDFYARMDQADESTAMDDEVAREAWPASKRLQRDCSGSSIGGPSISTTCDSAPDVLWGEYILQREAASDD
jgi:fructose-1,6-bisphosphatase I